MEGTGSWIFEDTEFKKWLGLQDGGLLWVQGKAGRVPSKPQY